MTVRPDASGYRFELRVRLDVTVLALLDVVEASNSFRAQLRVGLEWDVTNEQWEGCADFWRREFVPKMRLFFKNGEERSNILLEDYAEGADEIGTELVNKHGETKRFFRLKRRVTNTFRETFDLRSFPFDMQKLAIEFEAEPTMVLGHAYDLILDHPQRATDESPGCHSIMENADRVDDCAIETLYALTGSELAGPSELPQRDEYVVLIFVSRNFQSLLFNLIFPTLCIELLSFLTYWVNPCLLADRASITLTLFLTAVSFKTYTADKLPAVPYLTAVEIYLMVCMLLLSAQAVLLIWAAKFCGPDGLQGQFLAWRYRTEHGGDGDYDDGGLEWSEEVLTRMQNRVDGLGVGLTTLVVMVGFVHILSVWSFSVQRCFHIHAHKKLAAIDDEDGASCDALSLRSNVRFFMTRWKPLEGVLDLLFPRGSGTVKDFPETRNEKLKKRRQRQAEVHPSATPHDLADQAARSASAAREWRRTAVSYFRDLQKTATIGYTNDRIETSFHALRKGQMMVAASNNNDRRPSLAGAASSPAKNNNNIIINIHKKKGQSPSAAAAPLLVAPASPRTSRRDLDSAEAAESSRAAIVDAGTGETKMLLASFVDTGKATPPAVKVVDGKSFTVGGAKKTPLSTLCKARDTAPFEDWLVETLEPTFILDASDLLASAGQKGFDAPACGTGAAAPLLPPHKAYVTAALGFDCHEVAPDLFRAGKGARVPKGKKGAPPSSEEEEVTTTLHVFKGWALASVNGRKFSEAALCAQLGRCAELIEARRDRDRDGDGDRDLPEVLALLPPGGLRAGDRVRVAAGRALRYCLTEHGETVEVTSHSTPRFVFWPGLKGTVEGVTGDGTSVRVRWDAHRGDALREVTCVRDLGALECVAEVRLACLVHAEVRRADWATPKIVLGTGAWFRNSDRDTRAPFLDMVQRLQKRFGPSSFEMICLTALDEASYEWISIRYAHQCLGLDLPDATIAVGNGSTQFVSINAPELGHLIDVLPPEDSDDEGDDDRRQVLVSPQSHTHTPLPSPPRGSAYRARIVGRDEVEDDGDHHYARFKYEYSVSRLDTNTNNNFDGSSRSTRVSSGTMSTRAVIKTKAAASRVRDRVKTLANFEARVTEEKVPLHRVRPVVPAADSSDAPVKPMAPHLIQLGNTRGKMFLDFVAPNGTFRDAQVNWRDFATSTVERLAEDDEIPLGNPLRSICCISACVYAAKAADVPCHPHTTTNGEARARFQRKLNAMLADAEDKPGSPTDNLLISNLTYQIVLCDTLLGTKDTVLRFSRDWKISDVDFRTTWSSGWYLDYLARSKPKLRAATSDNSRLKGFTNLIV